MNKLENAKKYFLLAIENIKNGYLHEAEENLINSLKLVPDSLSTMSNLANVLIGLNKIEEAEQLIAETIEKYPSDYNLYLIKCNLFEIKGKNEEALETLNNLILMSGDINYDELFYKRGKILEKLLKFEDAILDYQNVIFLKPDHLNSYINLGLLLYKKNRYIESIEIYNKALAINDKESVIYNNLGLVYLEIGSYSEAISNFEKALCLNSNLAESYLNIGVVSIKLDQKDEALLFFKKAININKKYAEAYENLGKVNQELKNLFTAVLYYKEALKIKPEYQYLQGTLIHAKMCMCDWGDFSIDLMQLSHAIASNKKCSPPFPVINLLDSPQLQLKCAKIWSSDYYPLDELLGPIQKKIKLNKIKIAYFSSDFREHAVSYLIAELFELHDKENFEIYTFYYGPEDTSLLNKRIVSSCNKNFNVKKLSDSEVAKLAREVEIDIAIDLNGATANQRTKLFSYRVAPIQIGYLGYLGSMGTEYHYIIADKILIPEDDQCNYSEKIIYLPSYQINDRKRVNFNKVINKRDFNIPESGFIFCCFNNSYKFSPNVYESWMRILKGVSNSYLYLYADNEWVKKNILNETKKHGVDVSRIIFAGYVNRDEYLLRYNSVDLFLDTFPYNAGTTASDALWSGVPIITCAGKSFASRIGASLLNAIQIPELITTNLYEYEILAIKLANNPGLISEIREKINIKKSSSLLFNTPKWVENIEVAYKAIYNRYQVDILPDHIYI